MKSNPRLSRRKFYVGSALCAALLLSVTAYAQTGYPPYLPYAPHYLCPGGCSGSVPIKRCWYTCCKMNNANQSFCGYCTYTSFFQRLITPSCDLF